MRPAFWADFLGSGLGGYCDLVRTHRYASFRTRSSCPGTRTSLLRTWSGARLAGAEREYPRYTFRDLVPIQISNGEVTNANARVSGGHQGGGECHHETCQGSPAGFGSPKQRADFVISRVAKSRQIVGWYCYSLRLTSFSPQLLKGA